MAGIYCTVYISDSSQYIISVSKYLDFAFFVQKLVMIHCLLFQDMIQVCVCEVLLQYENELDHRVIDIFNSRVMPEEARYAIAPYL